MYGMNYIGRVISNFREFYNEINAATLTGAIDIVVIEQPDGSFTCSPFHVRFGKLGVLRSKEKVVDIEINSEIVDIQMKLTDSGEAFFVEPVPDEDIENSVPYLACSPLPSPSERIIDELPHISNLSYPNSPTLLDTNTFFNVTSDLYNIQINDEDKADNVDNPINDEMQFSVSHDESIRSILSKEDEYEKKVEDILCKTRTSDDCKTVDIQPSHNTKRKTRKKSFQKKKEKKSDILLNEEKRKDNLHGVLNTQGSEIQNEISNISNVDYDETITTELQLGCSSTTTDFHFFSDTDISPTNSPRESRPSTPFQSDTEVETKRDDDDEDIQQSQWRWGELPSSISEPQDSSQLHGNSVEAQRSLLSSMFSFMKKTKRIRHSAEPKGIYLEDLNASEMTPELAALYLSTSHWQQQNVQSPNSNDDNIGVVESKRLEDCKIQLEPEFRSVESEDFSQNLQDRLTPGSHKHILGDLAMSLCGPLNSVTEEKFSKHVVSYEDIVKNQKLVDDPNLVVRLRGKFCSWPDACLRVMTLNLFNRPLPEIATEDEKLANEELQKATGGIENNTSDPAAPRGYSYWFKWRHSSKTKKDSPLPTDIKIEATPSSENLEENELGITLANTEQPEAGSSLSFSSDELSESSPRTSESEKKQHYRHTLRLTSDQIKNLNLRPGANEAVFSVTTAYQGTTRCKCHIYRWRYDDKIIISDIDGTITKSDVLGHLLPIIGKDWAQGGVVQLFNKIRNNGYKLLYLSSRAIGQARLTRDYLKSIRQENLSLPDGPLLLNPTSLINAFHREVIEKKPEEFKIACLKDIQTLFPQDSHPFYAGYGNRINDVYAYRTVGIPISRIFTINHKGELKHELTQTFQSSYSNMSSIVDQIFPPLPGSSAANDYGSFVYWRQPIDSLV